MLPNRDSALGVLPTSSAPRTVTETTWFKRHPTGGTLHITSQARDVAEPTRDDGTVYRVPSPSPGAQRVGFFTRMPTGGGTVFTQPSDGGENGDR